MCFLKVPHNTVYSSLFKSNDKKELNKYVLNQLKGTHTTVLADCLANTNVACRVVGCGLWLSLGRIRQWYWSGVGFGTNDRN